MRNISFALTTQQVKDGTKDVTRRLGWVGLMTGDLLRPVKKCMGLKKGETIEILRDPIRVISVIREPLRAMTDDVTYGFKECEREGFGDHPVYQWPSAFVEFFCSTHKKCTPDTIVTRIEFEYTSADKYLVDCCNEICGWTGFSTDCVTFKHGYKLLCPECHEVVEPVTV
jgi:hypothetical protein